MKTLYTLSVVLITVLSVGLSGPSPAYSGSLEISSIGVPVDPNPADALIKASAQYTHSHSNADIVATWSWGDGSTGAGMVKRGNVEGEHTYSAEGVYTISLTLKCQKGETATASVEYAVSYVPSGDYATASGWIDVPSGSPTSTAKFGAVLRFRDGTQEPIGPTHFRHRGANISLSSKGYDWFSIRDGKATAVGSGTVNGSGDYGFLLVLLDGQLVGDSIDWMRIKIWNKSDGGTIVFDTQPGFDDDATPTTRLTRGKVIVHSPTNGGVGPTSVDEGISRPTLVTMYQNYPNPFNPRTEIRFDLSERSTVTLSIYDTRGRLVTTLVQGTLSSGSHNVVWNGIDATGVSVSTGIYYSRITVQNSLDGTTGFSTSSKIVLMK